MITKVIYSAPAKVHLSGEYSLMYGEPALMLAIDLRLKFTLFEVKKPKKMKDAKILAISRIVKNFLVDKKISFEEKNFDYYIDSNIPQTSGLGSLGSLAVATAGAFYEFYTGKEADKKVIYDISTLIEKSFDTNSFGIDSSAVCHGGLVYYRKEFDFLRNVNPLLLEMPLEIRDNFYLLDSGKRLEKTADMLAIVSSNLEENPALYKKLLRDIGKTTKAMTMAIFNQNTKLFSDTIARNQSLLEKLGIVSAQTSKILQEISPFGVGKITGSGGLTGGSGYLLFYCQPNKKSKLEKYLQDHKIPFIPFLPSFNGVAKED